MVYSHGLESASVGLQELRDLSTDRSRRTSGEVITYMALCSGLQPVLLPEDASGLCEVFARMVQTLSPQIPAMVARAMGLASVNIRDWISPCLFLELSYTVRELPEKSPKISGEVQGTFGEVPGLPRSLGEPVPTSDSPNVSPMHGEDHEYARIRGGALATECACTP